jgi:hypothetical protein
VKNKLVGSLLCATASAGLIFVGGGVANAGTYIPAGADGTYRVGSGEGQMLPGLWSTSGGRSCYWDRTGYGRDIIQNNFGGGPETIEIMWGDTSFTSDRCGAWERHAPVPNPIPGLPPIEAVDYRNMMSALIPLGIGSAAIGSSMLPALVLTGS